MNKTVYREGNGVEHIYLQWGKLVNVCKPNSCPNTGVPRLPKASCLQFLHLLFNFCLFITKLD